MAACLPMLRGVLCNTTYLLVVLVLLIGGFGGIRTIPVAVEPH